MSMSHAFIALLGGLTLLYIAGIGWLTRGLRAVLRWSGDCDAVPSASVIIAARNEETSIGRCLDAVLASDYPHFEVIVVDDGSTDLTVDVVTSVATRARAPLKLIQTGAGAPGKFGAIRSGVQAAVGEVIVTLDADCLVGPQWLAAMLSFMKPEVGFVAGPVAYEDERSLLRRMEALEFMSLIGVGAGAIGQGAPLICNSANAAYRKVLFDEMMSAAPPPWLASADELLMSFVHEKTPYEVAFCCSADALVTTPGAESLSHFVQQRMRWVGIIPHLPRIHVLTLAGAYVYFLMIALSLAAGFWYGPLAAIGAGALLAKTLADAHIIWMITRPFGRQSLLPVLPVAELAYLPYVLFTAPMGLLIPTEWKGRIAESEREGIAVAVTLES